MGCSSSIAKDAAVLKNQLVVSSPSNRGRILDGGATMKTEADDQATDAVVMTLQWERRDVKVKWDRREKKEVGEKLKLEVRIAATGTVALYVSGFEYPYTEVVFWDADGRPIALKESDQLGRDGEGYYWNFWAARPATPGQKSDKTFGDVPLYYWGMFKYGYKKWCSAPIVYCEAPQTDPKTVVKDGSAHLAMWYPSGASHALAIFGPGQRLDNLLAKKMPCGEPMAILESMSGSRETVTLTMASQADAVLLLAMAHCAQFASALAEIALAS